MKPHPRIRKLVKWGGAVVTVLSLVVWVGSGWWAVRHGSRDGSWRSIAAGHVAFGKSAPPPAQFTGFNALRFSDALDLDWWFHYRPRAPYGELTIPLWVVVVPLAIITILAWRADVIARRRAGLDLCPKCHYDRNGLGATAVCPECGSAPS